MQAATPVRVVSGITETQWTYDAAMAAADAIGPTPVFELETVRSDMVSFERYRFPVSFSFTPPPIDEKVVDVSNAGSFPFANNAFTRMPFYTETLDKDNAFASSNRYTVPSAGNYRFTLTVGLDGASTELPTGSTLDLKIDNFTAPTAGLVPGRSTTVTYNGTAPATLDVTLALAAGQVLSTYLRHNGGVSITLSSARLEIVRLA